MTNKGLGMTFISMQHIEKRFGDQEVLKDVSLEMKRGEIISDTAQEVYSDYEEELYEYQDVDSDGYDYYED